MHTVKTGMVILSGCALAVAISVLTELSLFDGGRARALSRAPIVTAESGSGGETCICEPDDKYCPCKKKKKRKPQKLEKLVELEHVGVYAERVT